MRQGKDVSGVSQIWVKRGARGWEEFKTRCARSEEIIYETRVGGVLIAIYKGKKGKVQAWYPREGTKPFEFELRNYPAIPCPKGAGIFPTIWPGNFQRVIFVGPSDSCSCHDLRSGLAGNVLLFLDQKFHWDYTKYFFSFYFEVNQSWHGFKCLLHKKGGARLGSSHHLSF